MSIKIIEDVGAPGLVAGVNIMLRQSTSEVMGQPLSDVATYGMTALGYLGAYLGWGGHNSDLLKNVAIASAPLAMEKMYDALKGGTVSGGVGQPVRMRRRVSTYNAPEFDVRIARRAGMSSKILV